MSLCTVELRLSLNDTRRVLLPVYQTARVVLGGIVSTTVIVLSYDAVLVLLYMSRIAFGFKSIWGESIEPMEFRLDWPNVTVRVEPVTDMASCDDGVTPPMSWPRSCMYIWDERTTDVIFSLKFMTRRPSPVVNIADENSGPAVSPYIVTGAELPVP